MSNSVSVRDWVQGARLRTLPLAVAPVVLGAGSAQWAGDFDWMLFVLCLGVAVALQVGVNYANDYSDGIRGTDDNRVGPPRLTGSGRVAPGAVKRAAFVSFSVAMGAGVLLVVLSQVWVLLLVGALAVVAAWFYTGGKNPYGYAGFGEIAVFVFFGLVATIGTAYIQIGFVELNSVLGGIAAGCFAAAVLMVNNIRDIETDTASSKKTLAVRMGAKWAKKLFIFMIWFPFVILFYFTLLYPASFLAYAAIFMVAPTTLIVLTAKTAKELILVLKLTSFASLAYALLLTLGLVVVFF
jgi:1,4-dihydroxy-2-naphthoate octaprenyltransferase